jgi:hypothetical protein
MSDEINLLDVVALTEDFPEYGLSRGEKGTVVEVFTRDALEVEFADSRGQTYAMTTVRANQVTLVNHAPVSKEESQ